MCSASINTTVLVLSHKTIILQDIQNSTHLRKNQNSGSLSFHPFKKFIKDNHFTRIENEMFVVSVRWTRFSAIEEIGMVAAFPQLHDNIEKTGFPLSLSHSTIDRIDILFQDPSVPFYLHF